MVQIIGSFIKSYCHYFTLQEGNRYSGPYKDCTFIKRSLIRIKVMAHPGTTNITFEPTPEQMKVQVAKWFHTIINVNYQLPSVDTILYPGEFSLG